MSKRRISHQQSARIRQKHQIYRQQLDATHLPHNNGLVLTRFGTQALIENQLGERILCSIRPTIDSLVAGDQVVWQEEGNHQGVVISRYPRHSVLGRPDKHGEIKPIAANLTQVIIVIAPKPEVSWPLLDSYLIIAEHFGLLPAIVLNKVDLAGDELKTRLLTEYAPLAYPILFTSQQDLHSYEALEKLLLNQTSVFVGQSGVGKSTLISLILPHEIQIQTQTISNRTELGKHTTSNSCLYHLPAGGALIDSPGVREIGLWHMSSDQIARGFREFIPFLGHCKFRNCNHQHDPGCALKEAVKNQMLNKNRYENYVKILTQFAK